MEIHIQKLEAFEPNFTDIANFITHLTIDSRFKSYTLVHATRYTNLLEHESGKVAVIQIEFSTWGEYDLGEGDKWLFIISRKTDFSGEVVMFFKTRKEEVL